MGIYRELRPGDKFYDEYSDVISSISHCKQYAQQYNNDAESAFAIGDVATAKAYVGLADAKKKELSAYQAEKLNIEKQMGLSGSDYHVELVPNTNAPVGSGLSDSTPGKTNNKGQTPSAQQTTPVATNEKGTVESTYSQPIMTVESALNYVSDSVGNAYNYAKDSVNYAIDTVRDAYHSTSVNGIPLDDLRLSDIDQEFIHDLVHDSKKEKLLAKQKALAASRSNLINKKSDNVKRINALKDDNARIRNERSKLESSIERSQTALSDAQREAQHQAAENDYAPQSVLNIVRFARDLRNIQQNYSYMFQSVEGLDTAYQKSYDMSNPIKSSGDEVITINCLENVDMSIASLMNRYFNSAFDTQWKREKLPANLRKFNCSIYVHDIRNFRSLWSKTGQQLTEFLYNNEARQNDAVLNTGGNSSLSYIMTELLANHLSVVEFKFFGCEFRVQDSGNGFLGGVSNADAGEATNKFAFTYDSCIVNMVPQSDVIEIFGLYTEPVAIGGESPALSKKEERKQRRAERRNERRLNANGETSLGERNQIRLDLSNEFRSGLGEFNAYLYDNAAAAANVLNSWISAGLNNRNPERNSFGNVYEDEKMRSAGYNDNLGENVYDEHTSTEQPEDDDLGDNVNEGQARSTVSTRS